MPKKHATVVRGQQDQKTTSLDLLCIILNSDDWVDQLGICFVEPRRVAIFLKLF